MGGPITYPNAGQTTNYANVKRFALVDTAGTINNGTATVFLFGPTSTGDGTLYTTTQTIQISINGPSSIKKTITPQWKTRFVGQVNASNPTTRYQKTRTRGRNEVVYSIEGLVDMNGRRLLESMAMDSMVPLQRVAFRIFTMSQFEWTSTAVFTRKIDEFGIVDGLTFDEDGGTIYASDTVALRSDLPSYWKYQVTVHVARPLTAT